MSPLKRSAALIGLSQDHRSTLMTAQMLKKGAPMFKGMPESITGKMQYLHQHFVMQMMDHFEKEEAILFPFISGRTAELDEMVEELKNEHIEITHHINALPAVADPESAMDKIGHLIERHIRKEERRLFELVQEHFSSKELEELGKRLAPQESK